LLAVGGGAKDSFSHSMKLLRLMFIIWSFQDVLDYRLRGNDKNVRFSKLSR
jgi:hypothetical protein